tara:strand:- start:135 stop:344 length:210 start_codon:yes stop_codon:yes gene_type:complete
MPNPETTVEPAITINGRALTNGQAMTVRCAIEAFAYQIEDGLGDDAHGVSMTRAYRNRISEIRDMIFNG